MFRVITWPWRGVADAFRPFTPQSGRSLKILAATQLAFLLLAWAMSPSKSVPSPSEVARAALSLAQSQGLLAELGVSLRTNLLALALSSVLSIGLAFLATAAFFRPLLRLVATARFLGLAGLTFVFTLLVGGGAPLKLALLTFGMTVFLVTQLEAELEALPQSSVDYARTLGLSGWRLTWELIVLGKAHLFLDLIRQNAAIGWTMLTMVEGLVRSDGGVGSLLLNENKYFRLDGVFAIQLSILFVGWAQDRLMAAFERALCPYSELGKVKGDSK